MEINLKTRSHSASHLPENHNSSNFHQEKQLMRFFKYNLNNKDKRLIDQFKVLGDVLPYKKKSKFEEVTPVEKESA